MLICLLVPSTAPGAEWKYGAAIGANATATDNITLGPAGSQQSDLALGITPSFTANLDGARLKVRANFAPTIYTYVQNAQNDYVAANFGAFASLEAAEKFFYIDAGAQTSETYLSPFAPQPQNGATITNNRARTTYLALSPYIQSTTSSGVSYLLRDDNLYTTTNNANTADIFTSNLVGRVDGPTGRPIRLGADYNYNYSKFSNQASPFRLQLARLRATHTFDPDLSATVDVGYEKNDYTLSGYQGPIYGAGFDWKPTDRADIYANVEHRFFGTSYAVGISNRTRMTAFNVSASRNATTTPQQFVIPAGNTQAAVNAIFQARIPDPVERQNAVNQFLQQTGLPPTLGAPLAFYVPSIYVVEQASATFAIIGVRNALTFGVSWSNNSPITPTGQTLPSTFTFTNEFTLFSYGVSFSHQISAPTSVVASANHSVGFSGNTNLASASSISSTQNNFNLTLVHQFSPKTSGSIGANYATFNSELSATSNQISVTATALHTF